MRIDVVVDTICPWCYIGKVRLDRALRMWAQDDVEIGWRPFQLNPNIPADGRDRNAYLADKFGGRDRALRKYAGIVEAGALDGIDLQFDRIERTPNTVNSHRLIAIAGRHGCQTETVDALFRAYFTDGRDIGDLAVLADIAAESGMPRDAVRRYLDGDEDRDRVLAEDELARRMGINGVPCYIVDRKYAISGAQSPEVFLQVFDLARHDAASAVAAE